MKKITSLSVLALCCAGTVAQAALEAPNGLHVGPYAVLPPGTINDLFFGDGDYVTIREALVDDVLEFRARKFAFWPSGGSGYSGSVGIGTADPLAKLDVRGSGYFSYGVPYWGTIANINANAANQTGGGIAISDDGGFFDYNDGYITYKNLCCGGGLKVDANFTVNGNVGIGTASPSRRLHVEGNEIHSGGGGAGFSFGNRETPGFVDGPGAGERWVWYASGGTASLWSGGNKISITPDGNMSVLGRLTAQTVLLTSDRAVKGAFQSVDNREILKKIATLPISTWHYTNTPSVRHIGPMAQDFKAAFNLGEDDKHIATVDADGVVLAAIQALHEMVQEKDSEIAALKNQVSALQTDLAGVKGTVADRLAALEKAMSKDVVEASFRPEAAR